LRAKVSLRGISDLPWAISHASMAIGDLFASLGIYKYQEI
jgi:hypothetical protein